MGKPKKVKKGRGAVGRPPGVIGGNERKCGSKKAYSKKTALARARHLRKRERESGVVDDEREVYPYLCECGVWHIGHSGIKTKQMKGQGDG